MRPDRIIVGEVRGEEALDMLQAMNTGHEGSLTTVHANIAATRWPDRKRWSRWPNLNIPTCDATADLLRDSIRRAGSSPLPTARERSSRLPKSPAWKAKCITMQDIFVFEYGIDESGKVRGIVPAPPASVRTSPNVWLPPDAAFVPRLFDSSMEV